MSTKNAEQEQVWVLKRTNEKNIGKKKVMKVSEVNGDISEEEIGEYEAEGLPGMKDDILPVYNINAREWAWGGTQEQLQNIVKELGLYDKKGKLIEKANRNVYADPFFTHERFRDPAAKMEKVFTFPNTIEGQFLRLNWMGWYKVLVHGDETRISRAELNTKEYLLILSSNLDAIESKNVDKKIEAFACLFKMTVEVKNLIGIITQEVYQIGNKDSEITPKLGRVAENGNELKHPLNKRLYSGMTAQEVLIEYADKDLETLTMAAVIIMAINKEFIRYSGDGYKRNDKVIGTGFAKLEELIDHYKVNTEEYDELSSKIRLK